MMKDEPQFKILVTGGAGFIGSHVVERYLDEGAKVVIVDDLSMGLKENIPVNENITFYKKSITDGPFMSQLLIDNEFDYIYLLAAIASVADTIVRPFESHMTNQEANLHMLEVLRVNGLKPKRVLFTSSAAVYGNLPDLPKTESSPVMPLTPYAIDKYATEKYVQTYYNLYGINTAVTRFFNVYGPRQNPKSPYSGVLSIITNSLKQNNTFTIFGDGEQTRDFIYIEDVVDALYLLATNESAIGNVYNVGTGSSVSLNDVVETYSRITNTSIDVVRKEARKGDIKFSSSDVSLIKSLGFCAKINVADGLSKYWESVN